MESPCEKPVRILQITLQTASGIIYSWGLFDQTIYIHINV